MWWVAARGVEKHVEAEPPLDVCVFKNRNTLRLLLLRQLQDKFLNDTMCFSAKPHGSMATEACERHSVDTGPMLAEIGQMWPGIDRSRPKLARQRQNVTRKRKMSTRVAPRIRRKYTGSATIDPEPTKAGSRTGRFWPDSDKLDRKRQNGINVWRRGFRQKAGKQKTSD